MRGDVGMLFQKCLKKIIVFPVIIVNIVCLLLVKILVSVYGIAHGVVYCGKLDRHVWQDDQYLIESIYYLKEN